MHTEQRETPTWSFYVGDIKGLGTPRKMEEARLRGFVVLVIDLEDNLVMQGYPCPFVSATKEGQPISLPWEDAKGNYYTNVFSAVCGQDAYVFSESTKSEVRRK